MAPVALATQTQLQGMRLPAALARFLVQLYADGRSPHTVAQYARHVGQFAEWVERQGLLDDVATIVPEHVAGFVASAAGQCRRDGGPKRPGSLNALRSSLRGFFGYLERAGIVERSTDLYDER